MKRLATAVLSAAALSAVIIPLANSSANADTKVFGVLDCKPISGLASVNANGLLVNNSFTAFAVVLCPLPRDRTNAPPTQVQVGFINQSTLLIGDGKFKCRVMHGSRTGSSIINGIEVQAGTTSAAGSLLTVPVPATHIIDGYYQVRCQIPRRGAGDPVSSMASIKLVEPDPGN